MDIITLEVKYTVQQTSDILT